MGEERRRSPTARGRASAPDCRGATYRGKTSTSGHRSSTSGRGTDATNPPGSTMPLSSRIPAFHNEPQYVLPPANITSLDTANNGSVHVDYFNMPPRPLALKIPPRIELPSPSSLLDLRAPAHSGSSHVAEEARAVSIQLQETSSTLVKPEDLLASTPQAAVAAADPGSSDSVLFLAADGAPEAFSPSLHPSTRRAFPPSQLTVFKS